VERGGIAKYREFGGGVESREAHAGVGEWDGEGWCLFGGAEREARCGEYFEWVSGWCFIEGVSLSRLEGELVSAVDERSPAEVV